MNLLPDTMPGTPGAIPTVADLAPHFPQLEIIECLGRGGMGIVYKARQPQLDRLVALKILAPERVDDVRFAERFRREGVSLARLDHPNIVTVFDTGEAGGFYYLLMEFVDGLNLREAIAGEKMPAREALAIVPLICAGLQYAHEQGVVHRDIKPENILLDKKGRVKIADFGVAKLVCGPEDAAAGTAASANHDPGLTLGGKLGTPQYMAPEQEAKSGLADHRSDIYALGVVFYEMLTGERPAKDVIAPSRKVQIDVRIDEIVLRALEKEPAKRYQTAGEFRTVVETVATSARGSEDSVRDPFSSRNLRRRKGSAPSRPEMEPRFSRLAIVGACSAMVLPLGLVLNQFAALATAGTDGVWHLVGGAPGMPMMALGLASMIGTTILGWIAVSQIRRSAGRIHGLELAVFDGLLVPVLMLGALWWVLWYSLLDWAFPLLQMLGIHKPSAAFSLIVWIPWLAISIWTGIRATRKVWRMLTQASKGETQSTLSPITHVGIAKTPRKDRMVLSGVGISVAVLMTLLSLFFWIQRPRMIDEYGISADSPDGMFSADGYTWHEMRVFGGDRTFYRFVVQGRGGAVSERWEVPVPYDKLATNYLLLSIDEILFGKHGSIVWSDDSKRVSFRVNGIEVSAFNVTDRSHSSPAVPSRSETPETPSFGPILERSILSENADAHGLVFYRFKDNKVVKPPFSLTLRPNQFHFVELTPELREWIKSEGMDVLFHLESESWAMMTLEMQEGFVGQPAEWDTIPAAKATTLFAARDARGQVRREVPASSANRDYSGFSSVNAFRTRDNLIGVYQLRTFKDDSGHGVMIRYKLVKTVSSEEQATSSRQTMPGVLPTSAADRIELLALANYPTAGSPWWTPEGRALTEPPVDPTDIDIRSYHDENHIWLTAIFRVPGGLDTVLGGDSIQRADDGRWLWAGRQFHHGQPVDDLAALAIAFPADEKQADLAIRLAHGAWRTTAMVDAGPLLAKGEISQGDSVLRIKDQSAGDLTVTVEHSQTNVQARVAIQRGEQTVFAEPVYGAAQGTVGARIVAWRFKGVESDGIDRFILQTRPSERVEFRNVALQRGLPPSTNAAGESIPAFGSGDSVLIWHWDMATEPLTVYVMEDRIFHDPAPLLARLAGLYRQQPFSAVPVRLGPAGWAEAEGRKVVRELENALRGNWPVRLAVGEVLAELPLEMDDGLYSVTVPAWDANKNSALDLDRGTLNQTNPPLSLDFSKPETLKAWRGMGFDAYVLPGSDMLMLPTLPAVLVPAADEWEQSEIAPRALMQKIDSLAGRDPEERPVIALFADDAKGGWLLTDYGSLLLVKVGKDGDDPGALKVSWRRTRQATLRGEASSGQTSPSGSASENTPEQVALAFMDAVAAVDVERALAWVEKEKVEQWRGTFPRNAPELGKVYGKDLERLRTFTEWHRQDSYAVARVATPIPADGTRSVFLILADTPEGWRVVDLDDIQDPATLTDKLARFLKGQRVKHVPDDAAAPSVDTDAMENE
ncbi:MAG: serine/threonine protein kinase [Akkermansiaceae bacterium]|nr:serine/threonine protein kinase [Akkermansiaceae bacterium]